jgi:protein gp37
MAAFSAIEWCTHTANPWIGCQKVGPGCDHCYAESRDKRFHGGAHWGPGAPRQRTAPATRNAPLKWNREAEAFRAEHGHWPRVFSGSLCDLFDNAVAPIWRRDHWAVIRETKNLRWILLTKRIGNVIGMLPEGWLDGGFDHVGIKITVVNQAEANRDVPRLLDLPMSGNQWRGVSNEPALGPVDYTRIVCTNRHGFGGTYDALRGVWRPGDDEGAAVRHPRATVLDWIVWGGESGDDARPPHPAWARAVRDQCAEAGTAFLMKQWGGWLPGRLGESAHTALLDDADGQGKGIILGKPPHDSGYVHDWGDGLVSVKVGKARAGRLLDGRTHHEFPRQLQ